MTPSRPVWRYAAKEWEPTGLGPEHPECNGATGGRFPTHGDVVFNVIRKGFPFRGHATCQNHCTPTLWGKLLAYATVGSGPPRRPGGPSVNVDPLADVNDDLEAAVQ